MLQTIHGLIVDAKRTEPLELSQILIRYALGIIITLYVIAASTRGEQQTRSIALMLIVAWAIGFGILLHLMLWPQRRIARRTVSICADALAISILIHYGERSAAIFFPVYIWTIFGNGFRFGISYMYASMAATSFCFGLMALTTPYWRNEWQFSSGVLFAMIALPMYTSSLIRKLRFSMEQAKAASAAKTQFLSMIGHELRTPLNAILGLAQLSAIKAASVREQENAAFTEIAARRLMRMLDSILKFQAIESGAGRVQKRTFAVLDILKEMEAVLIPLARKKNLDLSFRFKTFMPKRLRSDPDIIETVIINLVTNAIKYTASGFVVVELGFADGETLRLDVHDSGPGIAPELQPRVFDEFVRHAPTEREDEGGVGLGLSICKSLIGLLGGDIGFKSERGRGSTFWAEFPAERVVHSETGDSYATEDIKIAAFGLDVPLRTDIAREFQILSHREAASLLAGPHSNSLSANVVLIADPSKMRAADHESLRLLLDKTEAQPPLIAVNAGDPSNALFRRATAAVPSEGAVSSPLIRTVMTWNQRHLREHYKSPEALSLGKKTILVADDNAMNRQVTGQMLKLDGCVVLEAETGDDVLEQLLENDIDVALLDINMADQDGVEICKTYRAVSPRDSGTVIVGLTADCSKETRDRCLAAGMVDVLTKPLSLEDLRALLIRIDGNFPEKPRNSSRRVQDEKGTVLDEERVNHLIDLFGEDAFKNDFLTAFEVETSKSVGRLRGEMSHFHPGDAQKFLHAIKSSARTIGAARLAKHVSALEDLEYDYTQQECYESISGELHIFMNACEEFLNKEPT